MLQDHVTGTQSLTLHSDNQQYLQGTLTHDRVIQTPVWTSQWCPTLQKAPALTVYGKSAGMISHFEQKDTWQASTYPQSEIITVRELMVTNSLEVDCLQIELELHHHQSAIELRISFSQGKCTNTPIQEELLPPHLWKSRVKFKLCFPTVVLSNGIIGSMYKQSATDKDSKQHLMGYHALFTVICHSHS